MKDQKIIFANTFALTVLFVWVICTLGVWLLPGLSLTMSAWFMHGLNISTMGVWKVTLEGFILGGIVLMAFGWATGYVFGKILSLMKSS